MNNINQIYTCKICGKEKPEIDFSLANKDTGRRKIYCKICDRAKNLEYYNKDKEKKLKQVKDWQNNNKDKYLKYQADYRKNN